MVAKKKKDSDFPKVVKGTHLTVTTYEDGRTKLEWNDDQLLKEIREAIANLPEARKIADKKATRKKTATKKKA